MNDRRGTLMVMSGPSGTGKSTLIRMLRSEFPQLSYSVSYTTRTPRSGEVDGKDYHFVDTKTFLRMKEEGFFAEWAEVHANFYGTPLKDTLNMLEAGKDVLFDIDVKGARQLKESLPGGCYIFVLPPSKETLRERLAKRDTDDEATIERRLANAREEIEAAGEFEYWIVNDDLQRAYDLLRALFLAENARPEVNLNLLPSVLDSWKA